MAGPGDGRLIAVKSDLVREQLVAQLLEEVLECLTSELPAEARASLDRLPGVEEGENSVAWPGDRDVTEGLIQAGYWSRVVERRRFEPARHPIEWLVTELARSTDDGEPDDGVVAALSWQLALREPSERSDPDDPDSAIWRVPGPGGHVRHYLAVETVGELTAADRSGDELPASLLGHGKRAWVFGFLVACCQETVGRAGLTAR